MDENDEPTDEQVIALAKKQYHNEGTLEIDEGATISRGAENGAYVQAWVWVEFPEKK